MHGTMNFKVNTEKLKKLRKQKKLTQGKLAKKVGMSNTYYSDIENGRTHGSVKALARIAQVLDITIDELLSKEDENGER